MTKWSLEKKILEVFGFALAVLLVINWLSYHSVTMHTETAYHINRIHTILEKLDNIVSLVKDAESGQRGYIITGNELYLEPYNAAIESIPMEIKELQKLTSNDPEQQNKIDLLQFFIDEKLAGLKERVQLRRTKGFEPAAEQVRNGKGRLTMDKIRNVSNEIRSKEWADLKNEYAELQGRAKKLIFMITLASIFTFLLIIASIFTIRHKLAGRERA
jgi:CHASE3 domain sensor protein